MQRSQRSGALTLLCALALVLSCILPAHATYTAMHNMSSAYLDGAYPVGQLANNSGTFYGFTYYGVNGCGSFFKMTTTGGITTLREFTGYPSQPCNPNAGPLLVGSTLYGTSISGGANNQGALFSLTTTGTVTLLHSFQASVTTDGYQPYGSVIMGSDGLLYGTTIYGGVKNNGTVWSYNLSTSTFSVVFSFDSSDTTNRAYYPYMGVTEGPDGMLYGSTYYANGFNGGVYRLNKNGTGFQFLHGFTSGDAAGYNPFSDLTVGADGKLYGATINGSPNGLGALYKVDPSSGSVSLVWSFDGYTGALPAWSYSTNPQQRITKGSGNFLYGVTHAGGAYGFGTIYKLDTSTGNVTLVSSFTQTSSNGYANPLVLNSTTLYGTSYYGGTTAISGPGGSPNGYGSGFSSTTSGTFKLLHSFFIRDTRNPADSPSVVISGNMYGTALYGGQLDQGAIYKINTSTNAYSVLHSFNNYLYEGVNPYGGLFKAADGKLYGVTYGGGFYGGGTIFNITTSGTLTVIHHFRPSTEGWDSYRKLIQGFGGDKNLYGICYQGGPSGYGSIFKTDTAGKAFQVIHYFTNLDGRYPGTQLTVEPDTTNNTTKALYGLTYQGGSAGYGTLFKISPKGDTFAVLHNFAGTDGQYGAYFGGPMVLASGILYGDAYAGGSFGHGVLFKYDTGTSSYSKLHDFNNSSLEGYYTQGGLVADSSGVLYGACLYGGSAGYGTIWKFAPSTNTFTKLHDFAGQPSLDGANPEGGVMWDSTSGLLYGAAYTGGPSNCGQIFSQTTTP